MIKSKKIFKIIVGGIIFITLPGLLFFGFFYLKYNEALPTGIEGEQANSLAHKMLVALNYEAYQNTNYLEWTFNNQHHYKWEKNKGLCSVYWKDNKVTLNFADRTLHEAYVFSFKVEEDLAKELIEKAVRYFNNDSFWLVAPYKVFDDGAKRSLVRLQNGEHALLVTYTSGGSTPGDSYLWEFDASGKPESFKMWTSILPIDGLEASWNDWTTTKSGAQLPTFHKLLFLGLNMGDVHGTE